ncbi:UNVERIFIED_CONTAM: hypothetical protein HDU68_004745 [Siphonaria sp. JEL0065]|nr:hypothetical protein HDU68_004745 [Siphonaria sp. JEL0065]
MFFATVLAIAQIATAAIISSPAADTVVLAYSPVTVTYVADKALSSGSKDIYVYREPGHILIDEYHAPFTGGLARTFTFTAPETGPFEVVVYDVNTYGVAHTPSTILEKVSLTATARR